MIRQTSIDSYKKIIESGLLKKTNFIVYDYIYNYGPCSAKQCSRYFEKTGIPPTTISPVFAKLERQGVIEIVGEIYDEKTNRTVFAWDVTSALPIKYEKPIKTICKHCNGSGYIEETQLKMRL